MDKHYLETEEAAAVLRKTLSSLTRYVQMNEAIVRDVQKIAFECSTEYFDGEGFYTGYWCGIRAGSNAIESFNSRRILHELCVHAAEDQNIFADDDKPLDDGIFLCSVRRRANEMFDTWCSAVKKIVDGAVIDADGSPGLYVDENCVERFLKYLNACQKNSEKNDWAFDIDRIAKNFSGLALIIT